MTSHSSVFTTIAIPTYNNEAMLKRCLDSVLASADLRETLVVVVNNGSAATEDLVVGLDLKYIQNEVNLGAGASYNKAFSDCVSPYFVTLNDDVVVKDPRWLEKMRAEFRRDPLLGAVGVRGSCNAIDPDGLGYRVDEEEGSRGVLEYVEASCMMVRTDIVRALPGGLFDPAYKFAYFEDSDFSLRLRKQGYHVSVIDLEVEHKRAATTKRVIDEGVDVEGFHYYNQQVFKQRWAKYLRKRTFRERIAIRRTGSYGDVILVSAITKEIKKRNASAEITLYTNHPDGMMDNPDVKEIREAQDFGCNCVFPSCSFDRSIDLDGAYERRSGLHIIDAYAQVCGLDSAEKKIYVNPGEEAREWARSVVGFRPYAVIHPNIGQIWLGRNPDPKLFYGVVNYLSHNGWKIVLLGATAIPFALTSSIADLNLMGKTTLRQAFAIIEGAGLFFGVDGALMHAAQATGVPTVGIFGAMSPEHILLPVSWATALTAPRTKVGCLGCHEVYGAAALGRPGRCMRATDICMEKIEPGDAVKAIERVLKGRP